MNLIAILLCFQIGSAAQSSKIIIHTENCNELYAGINNYLSILNIDGVPNTDSIECWFYGLDQYYNDLPPLQLSIEKVNHMFRLRPEAIGMVSFVIKNGKKSEKIDVSVKRIEAVCRLGRYGQEAEKKLGVNEFKAQQGLIAWIECCGFDAKCNVFSFEMIHIDPNGKTDRILSKSARFDDQTKALQNMAVSGSLFIFRKIQYSCSQGQPQHGKNLIFEIR